MVNCFIYSKKGINAISLCISIIIYFSLSIIFPKTNTNVKVKARLMQVEGSQSYAQSMTHNWYLEIPKINLEAEISEGTDSENLNRYIAHFEETVRENGNIGLAAHNRGYKVNYFSKIKELEKEDKIYYTYNRKKTRIYCRRKRRNIRNRLE